MKEIFELTHAIEFSNLRTENILEVLDILLYELSGLEKNAEAVSKFIDQANTLIYFGLRQASNTNEKISLLSARFMSKQ